MLSVTHRPSHERREPRDSLRLREGPRLNSRGANVSRTKQQTCVALRDRREFGIAATSPRERERLDLRRVLPHANERLARTQTLEGLSPTFERLLQVEVDRVRSSDLSRVRHLVLEGVGVEAPKPWSRPLRIASTEFEGNRNRVLQRPLQPRIDLRPGLVSECEVETVLARERKDARQGLFALRRKLGKFIDDEVVLSALLFGDLGPRKRGHLETHRDEATQEPLRVLVQPSEVEDNRRSAVHEVPEVQRILSMTERTPKGWTKREEEHAAQG